MKRVKWLIYKFRSVKYLDYLIIDAKAFIILIVVFLINLYLFFPRPFVINIPSVEVQTKVVDAQLKIVSIFFGITFSFIVLSFNIFYKNFGRYAFLEFFRSSLIKRPFTIFLGTLCFLIYSLSYLNRVTTPTKYSNSIYFLSILFSLVSFLWIFPSIILLLRKSQSRKNIKAIVLRFGKKPDLDEMEVRYLDKEHDIHYKNPSILLMEIGTVAIKEFDLVTISTITEEILKYFKQCSEIEDETERTQKLAVYNDITTLFTRLLPLAVKERNTLAALVICRKRFELERHVLNNVNKMPFKDHEDKYRAWDLQFDIEQYFDKAIAFNEDEVCKKIIEETRDFISTAIPIVLPEGFKCDNQGDCILKAGVLTDNFRNFTKFNEQLLYYKKDTLYKELSNTYYTLTGDILKSNFDATGKNFLLTVLGNYEYDSFAKFVKKNDAYLTEIPFRLCIHVITNCGFDYHFKLYLKVIDMLFYNNQLNNIFLNELKAHMLGILRKLNESPQLLQIMFLSIAKFEYLRDLITLNDTDYRKEIYIRLHYYLTIVESVANEGSERGIQDKLNVAIANFPHLNTFEGELKNKGYVFDDRLF